MKNKLLTLIITGTIMCTALVGCSNSSQQNSVDMPKAGTEVEEQEDINTEAETENIESTEDAQSTQEKAKEVSKVQDGVIEETKSGDGETSTYRISYGGIKATGSNVWANLEFKAVSNLEEDSGDSAESGVWRYINDDQWITVAVWGNGLVNSKENNKKPLSEMSNDEIAELVRSLNVDKNSIEIKDGKAGDKAIFKFTREDEDLTGYGIILDDNKENYRWTVQFLMPTQTFDDKLAKSSAESFELSDKFTKKDLESEQ